MPNTTITVNTDALARAGLVPYIASWSEERLTRARLIAKGTGLAYERERPGDRDAHGVLWMRHTRAPGVGTPLYSKVHPYRQRRAMRHLLCQVCGGPADQDERGILWLLGQAEKPWPGAEVTAQPPVCLRCAGPASCACPHLRRRTLGAAGTSRPDHRREGNPLPISARTSDTHRTRGPSLQRPANPLAPRLPALPRVARLHRHRPEPGTSHVTLKGHRTISDHPADDTRICETAMSPLKTDGLKIRELRERKAFTLTEFAALAGYAINSVHLIEVGKANGGPKFIRAAARILDCQITDITHGPPTNAAQTNLRPDEAREGDDEPMTIVMREHPAWTLNDGAWLRAFSTDPQGVAVITRDRWHAMGPAAFQPDLVELVSVPASVPVSLRTSLTSLGVVGRWRTPDLWDAVATAIIRQVIRADQARILHHRFRVAHGQPVASPHCVLHLMPDAAAVANLPAEAFTSLGLAFKRRPLQAAAAAYLDQGTKWSELPPARLVEELQTVPRIGPWTAGAAVADFTHDWSLYPHGDLAVRKWAALAAPDIDWPEKEDTFAAMWRQIAGDQLGALTLFTLAWGASHGDST